MICVPNLLLALMILLDLVGMGFIVFILHTWFLWH